MQFVPYRTIVFLVLLYKNNCKGFIYDYGNDECPCDQSDSSCLVLTYVDGEEMKRVEKCADIFQAEAICHDYRSKLANIVSCKVEQQSFEDSPNIIDIERVTVRNIDIVKRDIANMWYRQIDPFEVMDISPETDESITTDPTTTEDALDTTTEIDTIETDSSTVHISTTTTSVISTESITSTDEPIQPTTTPEEPGISTDAEEDTSDSDTTSATPSITSSPQPDIVTTTSSTTEGSVTRTPRPFPNSGNTVNLTIFNTLFCAVAVLSLKLSSAYLNVY